MSIDISAVTRCNTSEFVDLLLSLEENGRAQGMEVQSDFDCKAMDLIYTSNGLIEVRGEDSGSGIEVHISSQTSILGPGYHKLVVDLLDRVSAQCGARFDVADDTDYYTHRDFGRMCREHFFVWLNRVVDLLQENEGNGYSGMMVNYGADWPVPEAVDGSCVTPFGRLRISRLIGLRNSKGVESVCRLFFPCNEPEIDGQLVAWSEAMHLLWCKCCFRPSARSGYDAEVNGRIIAIFEELIKSGSKLPIPKDEYKELCSLDGRKPLSVASMAAYESVYPIGYRRSWVAYRAGDVTYRLPGHLIMSTDENGSTVYCDGDLTAGFVKVSAYVTDGVPDFVVDPQTEPVGEGTCGNGRYIVVDETNGGDSPVMQVQLVTEGRFTLFTLVSPSGCTVGEARAKAMEFAAGLSAPRRSVLEQVQNFADNDEHVRIIDMLLALPPEELTDELKGQLARAYNNNGEYEKALPLLKATEEYGRDNANWNFRMGYSYYFLGQYDESRKYFKRALELDPDDSDAMWFIAQCGINIPFKDRVSRFWEWFTEHRTEIESLLKGPDTDMDGLGQLMNQGLDILGGEVFYNIGGDFELTLAVESGTECYYLYPYLVGAMPEELKDKWKVSPCKQPCDVSAFSLDIYGCHVDIAELLVSERFDKDHSSFSLTFYHPELSRLDDARCVNAFHVILGFAIGEGAQYNYVESVEPAAAPSDGMYPVGRLADVMRRTLEENGREFHSEPDMGYTAYESKPAEGERGFRDDVICGVSRCMPLCNGFMADDPSFFCRLADRGAEAMFIVLTRPDDMDSRAFLDLRYRVEDWCGEVLSRQDTPGMLLGGAMGCDDRAYIDIIAYDGPSFLRMLFDDDVLDSMLCCEDGTVAEAYVYAMDFMKNGPMTTLRDI